MKKHLAAIVMLICPSLRGDVDVDRMIRVLIQLEGGRWNDWGGAGHMKCAAWTDRTPLPYYFSRTEVHAIPVYRRHIGWICTQLTRHGEKITPTKVALAWRHGFEGARARLFRGEYGQRADNLYCLSNYDETIQVQ